MNTRCDPRELVTQLTDRSICAVRVAAVLVDRFGVCGWGWNSVGEGYGMHAEEHCLRRSSMKRWDGATMYVASVRARNNKPITSKPCADCQRLLDAAGIAQVIWRDKDGIWRL